MAIYEKEDMIIIMPHQETFLGYLKAFISDITLFQENQEKIQICLEDLPFLILNQIYFDLNIASGNLLYPFFKDILPEKFEKAIQSSEGQIDWLVDIINGNIKTPDFMKPFIATKCLKGYAGCKVMEFMEKYGNPDEEIQTKE